MGMASGESGIYFGTIWENGFIASMEELGWHSMVCCGHWIVNCNI